VEIDSDSNRNNEICFTVEYITYIILESINHGLYYKFKLI